MHTRAAAAVLAFSLIAQAQAGEPGHERYVADALEVVVTPTGESITRLVSRKRQTVRQFWVESVYSPQGTLVVMLEPARGARAAAFACKRFFKFRSVLPCHYGTFAGMLDPDLDEPPDERARPAQVHELVPPGPPGEGDGGVRDRGGIHVREGAVELRPTRPVLVVVVAARRGDRVDEDLEGPPDEGTVPLESDPLLVRQEGVQASSLLLLGDVVGETLRGGPRSG